MARYRVEVPLVGRVAVTVDTDELGLEGDQATEQAAVQFACDLFSGGRSSLDHRCVEVIYLHSVVSFISEV